MKKELEYILAILKARFPDIKMVFGFRIGFKGKNKYEASVKYGVPETCACVYYIGVGDNPVIALRNCLRQVLLDIRLETEIG